MHTCDTAVRVRGVSQFAKNQNRTYTRRTRLGNTAGLPVPVLNPRQTQVSNHQLPYKLLLTTPSPPPLELPRPIPGGVIHPHSNRYERAQARTGTSASGYQHEQVRARSDTSTHRYECERVPPRAGTSASGYQHEQVRARAGTGMCRYKRKRIQTRAGMSTSRYEHEQVRTRAGMSTTTTGLRKPHVMLSFISYHYFNLLFPLQFIIFIMILVCQIRNTQKINNISKRRESTTCKVKVHHYIADSDMVNWVTHTYPIAQQKQSDKCQKSPF